MSSTTVYKLHPFTDREPEELAEYRNSYGSAAFVWALLCERYVGSAHAWLHDLEVLGRLASRPDMPVNQRAVLVMTWDRAYIKAEHFARAAADIRAFLRDFEHAIKPAHVNHWPAIATMLEAGPDAVAIGFQMTSVSECLWYGEFDEEAEAYTTYDWSTAGEVYDDFLKEDAVHA